MEAIHDSGRARILGVRNVSLEQLQSLCDGARIRPSIVQIRCYAELGWDRQIREYCATAGLVYQGFSLTRWESDRNVRTSKVAHYN